MIDITSRIVRASPDRPIFKRRKLEGHKAMGFVYALPTFNREITNDDVNKLIGS